MKYVRFGVFICWLFWNELFCVTLQSKIEQWKKPWLVGLCRGFYYPSYMGIIINHEIRIPFLNNQDSMESTLPKTNRAIENPPSWWYLQGNMGIFMGYVSFREGTRRFFFSWIHVPYGFQRMFVSPAGIHYSSGDWPKWTGQVHGNGRKVHRNGISKIILWVVPPPSNSGNEGLGWDSLLKMVHNPGGDWNPGRGDNPNYTWDSYSFWVKMDIFSFLTRILIWTHTWRRKGRCLVCCRTFFVQSSMK